MVEPIDGIFFELPELDLRPDLDLELGDLEGFAVLLATAGNSEGQKRHKTQTLTNDVA